VSAPGPSCALPKVDPPLGRLQIFGYSALMWPLVMAAASVPTFIPSYYSRSLGLSLATIGIATLIGRFADIASDISVSYLSDNTRGRFGRRRPWVVLGTPLFLVTMWALCRPPAGLSPLGTVALMVAFFWCWTTVLIPYLAQASEITSNDLSRNRINVLQAMFSSFAGIIPSLIVYLVRDADPENVPYGTILTVTAIITMVTMPVALGLYVWLVPERVAIPASRARVAYSAVLGNRVFRLFLAGNVLIQAGWYWYLTLMPFNVSYVLEAPGLVLPLFLLSQAGAIGAAPLFPRLMDRLGRARAFALLSTVPALGMAVTFFLPPGHPVITAAVFIVTGLTVSPLAMLPFSIASDAAEYALWKTRQDSTGLHVGVVSLTIKLALVATGGALWLTSYFGFEPSHPVNSPMAIAALRVLATFVPAAMMAMGALCVLAFPITKRRLLAIQSRLRSRPSAPATDFGERARFAIRRREAAAVRAPGRG
jgi:Na+/melibiose symporter-like transporter